MLFPKADKEKYDFEALYKGKLLLQVVATSAR